jgi:aminoglycoside phosphotransferase (APT) family kinase protein
MNQAIDTIGLTRYLKQIGLNADSLQIEALVGGQSNPTFKVSAGTEHYVLRKKPTGKVFSLSLFQPRQKYFVPSPAFCRKRF